MSMERVTRYNARAVVGRAMSECERLDVEPRTFKTGRRKAVRNTMSCGMKPIGVVLMMTVAALAAQTPPAAAPPSVEETRHIEAKMTDLAARVKALAPKAVDPDLLADVDI